MQSTHMGPFRQSVPETLFTPLPLWSRKTIAWQAESVSAWRPCRRRADACRPTRRPTGNQQAVAAEWHGGELADGGVPPATPAPLGVRIEANLARREEVGMVH